MTAKTPSPVLSFVRSLSAAEAKSFGRTFRRHFWSVTPSGDYEADLQTGEKLALEYLAHEQSNYCGGLLQMIVADMPKPLTGVEISFLGLVAYAAGKGADNARGLSEYWKNAAKAVQP